MTTRAVENRNRRGEPPGPDAPPASPAPTDPVGSRDEARTLKEARAARARWIDRCGALGRVIAVALAAVAVAAVASRSGLAGPAARLPVWPAVALAPAIGLALLAAAIRAPAAPVAWRDPGVWAGALALAIAIDRGALVEGWGPAPLTTGAVGLAAVLVRLRSPRAVAAAQSLALVAAALAAITAAAYLHGVAVARVAPAALPGSLLAGAAAIGVLTARPVEALMGVVARDGFAGRTLKWMLPVGLTAPFVVGAVQLQLRRHGLAEPGDAVFLQSLLMSLLFATVTLLSAYRLEILDRRRRDSERDLRRRVAERDAANEELEAFCYSVSHDLRQPLRAIDGFSQALLEDSTDALDSEGRGQLERIRAAAQRMGVLIDDLLSLSRIGRSPMRLQPTDLSAIARRSLDALREREPERRVRCDVEEGVVAAAVDPGLVRVALDNLLQNAWKFSRDTPQAHVSFGTQFVEGELAYCVRDDGAGFDMAYADRLFAPFQRLHSPREFEGTGIGLAIVARVVHRHGGRVWAEAAVGEGATVYFTLGAAVGAPEGGTHA